MPYFSLHNVEKTQAKSLGFFLHLWKNIMFYIEILVKKTRQINFPHQNVNVGNNYFHFINIHTAYSILGMHIKS